MNRSIVAAAAAILFLGFTATNAQTTGGHSLEAVGNQLKDRFVCSLAENGTALNVASRQTGEQVATLSAGEKGIMQMTAVVGRGEEISSGTRRTLLSTLSFINTSLPIGTLSFASNGSLTISHHVGTGHANVDEIARILSTMIDQAQAHRVEILG